MICLMILNKSLDILQNHQQCLMGRGLFVNTAILRLNTSADKIMNVPLFFPLLFLVLICSIIHSSPAPI